MSGYTPRQDSNAWIMQVWIAFACAVMLCAYGVWHLPSQGTDRALLAVGFFFCLSASFTLQKTVRDNRDEQIDTQMWTFQVWAAFIIAFALTGWGLIRLSIDGWHRGFLVASALFLVSSSFVLAKTIRDNHEAKILGGSADGTGK
jgi:hypothetical protein